VIPNMKRSGLLIALSWIVALGPGGHAAAQVAGSTKLGVAVPANQLKQQDGKFVLPGASKEAIKALPKFEYARSKKPKDPS
jgi:hypothetical protein